MKARTRVWRLFRSAVTGRFVTRRFALRHRRTTIAERRRGKGRPGA